MAQAVQVVTIDNHFLEQLKSDYLNLILCAAGRVLSNQEDREDACSETLSSFARKRGQNLDLRGKIESYIWGVAHRQALEVLRRKQRIQARFAPIPTEDLPTSSTNSPSSSSEYEEFEAQLDRAIESLSSTHAQAIKLWLEVADHGTCAAILKIKKNTWEQRLSRARQALTDVLDLDP